MPNVVELVSQLGNYSIPTNISIATTAAVTGFVSEDVMVSYITKSFSKQCDNPILGNDRLKEDLSVVAHLTLAGVVFDEKFAKDPNSTDTIRYTIRLSNTKRRHTSQAGQYEPWDTTKVFSPVFFSGPVDRDSVDGGSPGYWQEGFVTLQKAIDEAIGYYLTNTPQQLIDDKLVEVRNRLRIQVKLLDYLAPTLPVSCVLNENNRSGCVVPTDGHRFLPDDERDLHRP